MKYASIVLLVLALACCSSSDNPTGPTLGPTTGSLVGTWTCQSGGNSSFVTFQFVTDTGRLNDTVGYWWIEAGTNFATWEAVSNQQLKLIEFLNTPGASGTIDILNNDHLVGTITAAVTVGIVCTR